jgi:hypothetical protein
MSLAAVVFKDWQFRQEEVFVGRSTYEYIAVFVYK